MWPYPFPSTSLGTHLTLLQHLLATGSCLRYSLPQIKTAFNSPLTDVFGGVVTKAKVTNFTELVCSEFFFDLLHSFSQRWFQELNKRVAQCV